MSESQSEQTFISNAFGTVTSKRVIYNRARGWLSGGSREDIPLKHVTAVRPEICRNILGGILFTLIGLPLLLAGGSGGAITFGALLIALAVICFWGSPAVIVNTAGQDLRPSKGRPWEREAANSFVEALRAQLFRE
jgi:hypothetical protein